MEKYLAEEIGEDIEEEQSLESPVSPVETQVTGTEASTLPSPEYTDVEADLEGNNLHNR